jgi:hypothetical protein
MGSQLKHLCAGVARISIVVTLLFFFNLAFSSPARANPISIVALPGATFRITPAGPGGVPEIYTSAELLSLGNSGSKSGQFKFSIGKVGQVVITSLLTGADFEPIQERLALGPALPSSTFTVGVFADNPGEQGFASLDFTGLNTDITAGGSVISIGITGGSTATYDTLAGDTISTVFANLLASLQGDGVNAYINGDHLVVLGNITDNDTLAGEVTFTTTDPTFAFDVGAGTLVPEPSSLALVASGVVGIAGCVRRRWRLRG